MRRGSFIPLPSRTLLAHVTTQFVGGRVLRVRYSGKVLSMLFVAHRGAARRLLTATHRGAVRE